MAIITFIGAGNMATSLIGGLAAVQKSADSQPPADELRATDINSDQLTKLSDQFGVLTFSDNQQAVADADVVMLAVKPNTVKSVCLEISEALPSNAVLISIAAGVREQDISRWLNREQPVVRCMPNTPALLGAGISGLFANTHCSAEHQNMAERVLKAAGKVIDVDQESDLDTVTAISGSGPAYFFRFIECMTRTGIDMGLTEEKAADLAIETAYGAALMARQRTDSPGTLRENVTSKGGTTAAALNSFEKDGLPGVIERGMNAAHARAVELGDEFGSE